MKTGLWRCKMNVCIATEKRKMDRERDREERKLNLEIQEREISKEQSVSERENNEIVNYKYRLSKR
jgi:hypothetical protein